MHRKKNWQAFQLSQILRQLLRTVLFLIPYLRIYYQTGSSIYLKMEEASIIQKESAGKYTRYAKTQEFPSFN